MRRRCLHISIKQPKARETDLVPMSQITEEDTAELLAAMKEHWHASKVSFTVLTGMEEAQCELLAARSHNAAFEMHACHGLN